MIQTGARQHVDMVYLVPHRVTRWWVPVEADASGSSCFGLRVWWGAKETTDCRGFRVGVALLLQLGNLWRLGNCRRIQ